MPWETFRKKTTIKAKIITGPVDLDVPQLRADGPHGFQVKTREGLSDHLPWGYWVATDGYSYWPIAQDFMDANYERVET